MLIVAVEFRVTADKRQAFTAMAKALTSPTLTEDGYHFFEFRADLDNTGRFAPLESWESEHHLEEHRNTPHVAAFRETST